MNTRSLPITLLIAALLLTACPDNTPLNCGDHQIEVNGNCECEDGYHWNEDQTRCLMDTTSHNFVWEIDTLGNYGSYLNDVAIVDENNIWVVGNIETDSGRYNLAKWDGINWKFELVGPVGNNLYSILFISESDIWVTNPCSPYHWDGSEWTYYRFSSGGVGVNACAGNAIWGSSPSDIYFVGDQGSIVHYNGTGFERMESPTSQDLDGIVGVVNPETNAVRLWAYGWTDYPHRGLLLQFDGAAWEIIWDEEHPFFDDEQYVTPTVWAGGEYFVSYTSGYDHSRVTIHDNGDLSNYSVIYYDYDGYIRDIGGRKINDLFFVGDFANVFHYNGSTIKLFKDQTSAYPISRFWGVDYKNGMVVIVSDTRYVLRGYHIN